MLVWVGGRAGHGAVLWRWALCGGLVASVVLAMLVFAPGRALAGQVGCQVGDANPQQAWAQGPQTITVSVDMDSSVFPAVQQAFTNWQNSPAGQASGVTFNVQQVPVGGTPTGQYVVDESVLPADEAAATNTVPTPQVDRTSATTTLNLDSGLDSDPDAVERIMAHEIGHTFGLPDAGTDVTGLPCAPGTSVMNPMDESNPDASLTGPTADDSNKVIAGDGYTTPGGGGGTLPPRCPPGYRPVLDGGCNPSPIIIDVDGSGFHLTSAAHGVRFDFYGDHHPIKMAWIAPGSTNAFLVLPQHGNVTSGRELFGNLTPQPHSAHPNGFLALATYASLGANGHRSDVIDSHDPIYSRLRLWQFSNRDGRLAAGKLSTLPQLGIKAIYLNYRTTSRTDRYRNAFRYQARVLSTNPHAGKYAYDVFFTTAGAAVSRPATATSRPSTGHDILLGLLALLPLALLAGWRLNRRRSHEPAPPATTGTGDLQPSSAEQQSELAARH